MRESSQKEVECNGEPLPPGEEQVEVERAWLVGRDSVKPDDTDSGENQADREKVTRREERRMGERGEGQLVERRQDLGARRGDNSYNSPHLI